MLNGEVKFFNVEKGFGFIKYKTEENKDAEIFVHISGINGNALHEGDAVNFEIGESKKGPTAVNVSVAQ